MLKNEVVSQFRHAVPPAMGFGVFVAGYVAILFWFKEADVYHTAFSMTGARVAIYNVCRIAYIFYLFWMIYQAGNFLLTCVAKESWETLRGIDRIATGFFAGTGVWHTVLLLLGYLSLYTVPIAVLITLPMVAFAYRDLATSFSEAQLAISGWFVRREIKASLFDVARVVLLAAAIALLLVKGLYPAGGHDFYLHYFEYYKSVVDHHGIWPTAYYTHGYDSKGDGLVFLSMILTDAIASQLVTYCFIVAGGLALHQFLSRIAPDTLWPLVGVILYFSLYIYTPGIGEFARNGGWGDFEKWHDFTTATTIAILWLTAGAFDASGGIRLLKLTAAGSAVIASVIIDYTFAVYLGLMFALLTVFYFAQRRRYEVLACIALATIAACTLVVMMVTNYLTTGLLGDIAITTWWPLTNVERLSQTGNLLTALQDYWARLGLGHDTLGVSETVRLIILSARLELLYPLATSAMVAAIIALAFRRTVGMPRHQTIAIAGAVLAYVIFALALGRNGEQSISFFRYSAFTIPIVIAFGVALWAVVDLSRETGIARGALSLVVPIAVVGGCWSAAWAAYPSGHLGPILVNAARFAFGQSSIDEAYTQQEKWPGRMPDGAIYPGARGAYSVVGPHVRIWSFHSHAYCMLPDCDVDVYNYGSMTGKDEEVFFGTAEEAEQALKKANLNYFLISDDIPVTDPVVLASPLFAPDNIANYFGLRWTDGTTSLLTWRGPDTTPLNDRWLAMYCTVVNRGPSSFHYGAMRKIFADLHARPHPWNHLDLSAYVPLTTSPDTPQYKCPSASR